jgi:hypothetical protein
MFSKSSEEMRTDFNYQLTGRFTTSFSVMYLDPALKGNDPFNREVEPPPPVIKNADDPDAEWEVESIIRKRVTGRRTRVGRSKVEYLVRWKDWGAEYDD